MTARASLSGSEKATARTVHRGRHRARSNTTAKRSLSMPWSALGRRQCRSIALRRRTSGLDGFVHPGRDVSLAMQNAPNVDLILALHAEDQMRMALQRPDAKSREVGCVGVARRAGRRMAADVATGLLPGIDEAERGVFRAFGQVTPDRLVHVPIGRLARDDRPGLQPPARRRTRSRKASKQTVPAGAPGAEPPPRGAGRAVAADPDPCGSARTRTRQYPHETRRIARACGEWVP